MTEQRLAALWKIADHIPENWGDECKDGYVRLNISADAIEAVQAAIMPIAEDADNELEKYETINTDLLEALKNLCAEIHKGRKYSPRKDFSLLLADSVARTAIHKAEELVTKHKPTESYAECGCCGQFHRSSYRGDCRNDNERFNEEDIPENSPITYLEEEN